jgi:hypothetical protein
VKIKEPISEELDKLLSFLPAFEKEGRTFGHWNVSKPEDKEKHFPYAVCDEDVDEFFGLVGTPSFTDKDYLAKKPDEWIKKTDFYKTATLDQLITLLTFFTRGERFCEGTQLNSLKNGHIQNILRRMKELRRD